MVRTFFRSGRLGSHVVRRGGAAPSDRHSDLVGAIAHLAAAADHDLVVAHAEAAAKSIFRCDEATLTVGGTIGPVGRFDPWRAERIGVDLVARDGTRFGRLEICRLSGPPFRAEERADLSMLGLATTAAIEAVTARADARRAQSELDQFLAAISEGVFTLDPTWRIRTVNAAALTWLGRDRCEIVGAPFGDAFRARCPDEPSDYFARVMATGCGEAFAAFCEVRQAWLEVRVESIPGGLLVFFRDITRERETAEKLRQSQKLDAIGQLIGGIAHDVNNMLTVILASLEELVERAQPQGMDVDEHQALPMDRDAELLLAQAALRAGESAADLMGRLLAFSRRQPLSPRVVDVTALLESLRDMLQRTLAECITLRINHGSGLWNALVDPTELESAILNLVLNAQDAMQSGGALEISTENVEVDRVYAVVAGLERTGNYIMLSVADTGAGMSREVMRKAFEPFFTTKEIGTRTGLGLSMVYGFARQSGGLATIDSEAGVGTIVRIYLPRSTLPLHPAVPPARAAASGTGSVLLVEDNNMVRAQTEKMLRGLGYEVASAGDGPQALQLLAQGFRPDLLLTDVILPGKMSGRDVADASAAIVPGIRVLFTSGYTGGILLRDGGLPSHVSLLSKPYRRSELAAHVRAQLSGCAWQREAET